MWYFDGTKWVELSESTTGAPFGDEDPNDPNGDGDSSDKQVGEAGDIKYNTTTKSLWYYDGTIWKPINTDEQLFSEILTANNDAGGNLVKNIANPVEDQDATTKIYVDGLLTAKLDKVAGKVLSSNDYTDAEKLIVSDAEVKSNKNLAGGYPGLDANKKIDESQLPKMTVGNVFAVNSEVEQLALTAVTGDVAVRSDLNKTFMHNGGSAGDMTDWTEMKTPTGEVFSVNGKKGDVLIGIADIPGLQNTINNMANLSNVYTKPESNTLLDAKIDEPVSQNNKLLTTDGSGNIVWADKTAFTDTDDQILSLIGNKIAISEGNEIDLSSILVDDKNLSDVLNTGNDAGGKHIKNLLSPVDDKDAATKLYVDGLLSAKVDKVTGKDLSTNDYTNADKAIVDDAEQKSNKNVAGGYPGLDSNKKIDESQLPKITVGNVYAVNNETEQLALSASRGDVAVRSDENKTYMHNGGSVGNMTDWTEMKTPSGEVFSVNGKKGDVTLNIVDIPGLQVELDGKSNAGDSYTKLESDNLLDVKIDKPTGENDKMLTTDTSGNLVWSDKNIFTNTDDQTLSLSGTNLGIADGNTVDLSMISSDDQLLTKIGSTLTLENGGSVTLNDDNVTNEIQDLSLVGGILKITNNATATSIDLSSYQDNTDSQLLNISGSTLSISNGNSINLTGVSLDEQVLSLLGSTLSISNGNDVDLSDVSSDDQNLSEVLSQGNNAGSSQIKNLVDPTDDKDATTKIYVDGLASMKVDKEAGKQLTSNDYTDSDKAIVTDAEQKSNKNEANGYAGLDINKKIDESQLPKITVGNVYAVNNEVEQLALTAVTGDVAVRSDENKTYMHNGGSVGDMTDWTEMKTPSGEVFSVNGKKGDVTLNIVDIPGLQTTINNMADISNVYTKPETNALLDNKIDNPSGQNNKILATDATGTLIWADKSVFTDSDDQTLSLNGKKIAISEGNEIDLTALLVDNQDLADVLTQGNSAGGKNIKNLLNPVDDQDATTKLYVDGLVDAKVDEVAGKQLSTNDYTDADKAIVDDAEQKSNKNVAGGYSGLDSNKKIDESQLPKITVGNVYAVNNETEQLALSASRGDVAVRSDENKTYMHNGGSVGNMTDWTEMKTPSGEVFSVNGKKGDVLLNIVDIPGLQTELDGKADAGTSYTKTESDALFNGKIDEPSGENDKMLTTDATGNLVWADKATFTDTDDQTLNLIGTTLEIADGNTVDLSAISSDDQALSKLGSSITLENGGSVTLNDDDASNEIQDLSLVGNTLKITNNTSATILDLSSFKDNADDQLLTKTGNSISLENGGTVTLNDDDNSNELQNLSGAVLDGSNVLNLSIENGTGTTVDLSALADNTDDQTLSLAGMVLSIKDGNSVDLSTTGSDDQNLTEVLSEGNDAGGVQIKNIADPTEDQDAVTRYYSQGQLNTKVDKEAGKQLSSNDYTDAEKLIVADAELQTNKNAVNGYAGLDSNKKIDESQLPKMTVGNVYAVNSEAEQLALSAVTGDVAVRSDENKTYMHNGGVAGDMTDWTEMKTPTGEVFSVNGKKGDVVINVADIPGLQTTINNMSDLSNVYTKVESNTLFDGKIDEPSGENSKVLTTDSSGNLVWADKNSYTDTDDQTLNLAGNVISISEGNAVDLSSILVDDQDLGDVLTSGNDAKNNQIKNLAAPTDDKDAVNKIYVTGELFKKVDTEVGKGLSSNDYTDAEKLVVADAEQQSNKNIAGGYPGLDINKKIDESQLPKITVGNVFAVDSEIEQLALSSSRGDVAVRSDENKTYMHNGGADGTMADWTEMKTPSGEVFSVNGKKGDVTLNIVDIPGLQDELDDKADAGISYTKTESDALLENKIDVPAGENDKMLTTDATGALIWADKTSFTDTDDQTLSISGTTLSIDDGNSVDLSGVSTDDQTLTKLGSTITLENGGSITLSDDEATNEIQDLSLTGDLLTITNNVSATNIDLTPYKDNTDDQFISLVDTDLSISNGNSINLSGSAIVLKEDLVDNLIDGGTDKALTAEQGKILKEGLDGLKTADVYYGFKSGITLDAASIQTLTKSNTPQGVYTGITLNVVKDLPFTLAVPASWRNPQMFLDTDDATSFLLVIGNVEINSIQYNIYQTITIGAENTVGVTLK